MNEADANKRVVAQYLEHFSSGDIAGVLSSMDDESDWWVSGGV